MSGVFGNDGYLYQAVVVLNQTLDWLLNKKLDFILIECETSSYSVDAVFVGTEENKPVADFKEIKGGMFDPAECIKNIEKCIGEFLHTDLPSPKEVGISIIYKDNSQVTKKKKKLFSMFLTKFGGSLDLSSSKLPEFTGDEYEVMEKLVQLIDKAIPKFNDEYLKKVIYLKMRHYFEIRIQAAADRERQGASGNKFLKINVKDLLLDGGLSEVLIRERNDLFGKREDVIELLLGNKEGENEINIETITGEG